MCIEKVRVVRDMSSFLCNHDSIRRLIETEGQSIKDAFIPDPLSHVCVFQVDPVETVV